MGCLLYRKLCEASEPGCETEVRDDVEYEVLRCGAKEVPGRRAMGWLSLDGVEEPVDVSDMGMATLPSGVVDALKLAESGLDTLTAQLNECRELLDKAEAERDAAIAEAEGAKTQTESVIAEADKAIAAAEAETDKVKGELEALKAAKTKKPKL